MCCSTETLEELLYYFHRSAIFYDYLDFKGEIRQNIEDLLDTLKCVEKACMTHSLFMNNYKDVVYCKNCDKIGELKEVRVIYKKSTLLKKLVEKY